jgi:hypothetical protein
MDQTGRSRRLGVDFFSGLVQEQEFTAEGSATEVARRIDRIVDALNED